MRNPSFLRLIGLAATETGSFRSAASDVVRQLEMFTRGSASGSR